MLIQRLNFLNLDSDVIEHMGLNIVPYVVLLVVPVLGRMSDQCEDVRLLATHCFATLIRLMPLEVGAIYMPSIAIDHFCESPFKNIAGTDMKKRQNRARLHMLLTLLENALRSIMLHFNSHFL